jgi:hypothetical protein
MNKKTRNTQTKKLTLSRETLRSLAPHRLAHAHGGAASDLCTTFTACTSCNCTSICFTGDCGPTIHACP